jgi:hypothetical protein
MRPSAVAIVLGLGVGAAACTPPASPPPPRPRPHPAAPTPSAADRDPLVAGPTGFFRSKRFDLRIPFPDGATFKIDDTRGPWLSARHESSRSTLVVRRWHEPDLVNHESCEAKARTLRALPSLDDAEIIDTRTMAVPPDHDTNATVALVHPPQKPGTTEAPPLYGVVLAFGGFAHDCFAYAFVTEATGPDAESVVAARLVRVVDGSLTRIEAKSDLDPTMERDTREK